MIQRKAQFFPVADPKGQPNCKQWHRIERDGSVTQRVFLDVPKASDRENLICTHYLRFAVRHFYEETTGINVLARDAPWDFRLELDTGRERREFNLEITAIADNTKLFEVLKAEERMTMWRSVAKIPLHELKKLSLLFPMSDMPMVVQKHLQNNTPAGALVDNPLYGAETPVRLSAVREPIESLEQLVQSAITKKDSKNHSGKEETVLIVDNRTSAFDVPEYRVAARALEPFFASLPFPEIWFYTGYYSSNDGAHAEFSFSPLKVTDEQQHVLEAMSENIDENGRFVW